MSCVTFLFSNKKVTKEIGYEGAELIAPAIKAAPSNSPPALTMVQHSLPVANWFVPEGNNNVPKDIETKVQCAIRLALAMRYKFSGFIV